MADLILPPEPPKEPVREEIPGGTRTMVNPMTFAEWEDYKSKWPGNCTVHDMPLMLATIESLVMLVRDLRKDAFSYSPANDLAVPYQRMVHCMLKKRMITGGKEFLPWEFIWKGVDPEKEQLNVGYRDDGLVLSIGGKGGNVILAGPGAIDDPPPHRNGKVHRRRP